jgi:hypothetical protein
MPAQRRSLQLLQNGARTFANLSRRTQTRALHLVFQLPHVYDYTTNICRKQAEVIQNHDKENVRNVGKSEAQLRKQKRLRFGGG